MTIAIDTNVLVRLLVQDDQAQFEAARTVVSNASDAGESVLILLGALLETEWVLRSRYKLNRVDVIGAISGLLESLDVEFEDRATVEETLFLLGQHPAADFADCLLVARAVHMGCDRFLTFDAGAAKLPHAELIADLGGV